MFNKIGHINDIMPYTVVIMPFFVHSFALKQNVVTYTCILYIVTRIVVWYILKIFILARLFRRKRQAIVIARSSLLSCKNFYVLKV